MDLRHVEAADWAELREIRLRALADAPYAFASTLEKEAAFPEHVWRQRAQGGPVSTNFIIREDGVGVGVAAVVADAASPGTCSLWGCGSTPDTVAAELLRH